MVRVIQKLIHRLESRFAFLFTSHVWEEAIEELTGPYSFYASQMINIDKQIFIQIQCHTLNMRIKNHRSYLKENCPFSSISLDNTYIIDVLIEHVNWLTSSHIRVWTIVHPNNTRKTLLSLISSVVTEHLLCLQSYFKFSSQIEEQHSSQGL
jgi:hypothetical protein